MIDVREIRGGPLVSVIVTTTGRRGPLTSALRTAAAQTYRDIEVLVANDGGADVADVVASACGGRALLRQWRVRRGRAATLNETLRRARGRYVCYLDEADVYHRDHVQALVEALESPAGCQAAYSDICHTLYRDAPDGRREVLGKVPAEGRDFDRFFLLHRNHVPQTALMHRRDLIERAGGFNERLDVFVGWDMNRRLALLTDFIHVPRITAEAYTTDEALGRDALPPGGDLDALAEQRKVVLAARPPKPWPKMSDLAVVVAPQPGGEGAGARRVEEVRKCLAVPYRLYLAAAADEAEAADDGLGNLVRVDVGGHWPQEARLDKAVRCCEGDCIAIVPPGSPAASLRIGQAVYALTRHAAAGEAMLLGAGRASNWGAVFRAEELLRARHRHPALTIRRSAEAEGIAVRRAAPHELPFAFDTAMKAALAAETDGDFPRAASIYRALRRDGHNALWATRALAEALWRDGRGDDEALAACREVNGRRPSVDSLLLEARLHHRAGRNENAVDLLERARAVLAAADETEVPTC